MTSVGSSENYGLLLLGSRLSRWLQETVPHNPGPISTSSRVHDVNGSWLTCPRNFPQLVPQTEARITCLIQ